MDEINTNLEYYSNVNVYQGSPNDYTDGKHNLATPDISFEYFEYIDFGINTTSSTSTTNTTTTTERTLSCDSDWTFFKHTQICYRFYTTIKDWTSALSFCKSETTNPSANLVSIPDQTTNNFLLNTMPSIVEHTEVWTGGYRENGEWVWSDGSQWTGWTNWYPGKPSGGDNNYLEFWGQRNSRKWNNVPKTYGRRILCQYDPDPTTATATPTTTKEAILCDSEWTFFEHTQICYRFYTTIKDWTSALSFCKSETTNPSANLVSIPDQTTNNFLLNTMPSIVEHTEVWTGGYRENGEWVWSDGSQWTGWTNWYPGKPSGGDNNYLEFWGRKDSRKWNNVPKTYGRRILCQYDPTK